MLNLLKSKLQSPPPSLSLSTKRLLSLLTLSFSSNVIPHPEKAAKGGEDSLFIDVISNTFGVSDGVGGWAESGIDPALYSKQLMQYCNEKVIELREKKLNIDPVEVLIAAWKRTDAIGSATGFVATLGKDNILSYANVGDSGLIILRLKEKFNDKEPVYNIIYRTVEQQHYFNCPFQLSSEKTKEIYGSISDNPAKADKNRITIKPNDIVIAATDGVLDNVFDREFAEIASVIYKSKPSSQKEFAAKVAEAITLRGHTVGKDHSANTPFGVNALKSGYRFKGGKLDDCTTVVAIASEALTAKL